jgi:hypothetical protein
MYMNNMCIYLIEQHPGPHPDVASYIPASTPPIPRLRRPRPRSRPRLSIKRVHGDHGGYGDHGGCGAYCGYDGYVEQGSKPRRMAAG